MKDVWNKDKQNWIINTLRVATSNVSMSINGKPTLEYFSVKVNVMIC